VFGVGPPPPRRMVRVWRWALTRSLSCCLRPRARLGGGWFQPSHPTGANLWDREVSTRSSRQPFPRPLVAGPPLWDSCPRPCGAERWPRGAPWGPGAAGGGGAGGPPAGGARGPPPNRRERGALREDGPLPGRGCRLCRPVRAGLSIWGCEGNHKGWFWVCGWSLKIFVISGGLKDGSVMFLAWESKPNALFRRGHRYPNHLAFLVEFIWFKSTIRIHQSSRPVHKIGERVSAIELRPFPLQDILNKVCTMSS